MEPRARWPVWPGRRCVPGIVAPDSWGARGAECLPRNVLRRSSPATSPCDGTTARRCLCHGIGSGTTEARPPASSVPPAPHGGLGGLSRHPANSGPDFRSSSSLLLPLHQVGVSSSLLLLLHQVGKLDSWEDFQDRQAMTLFTTRSTAGTTEPMSSAPTANGICSLAISPAPRHGILSRSSATA